MSEPYAFLHGCFLPQSQAQLPLHDAGFVLGATITDLCRTFAHRLYRWEDHARRFRDSCKLADIDSGLDDSSISRLAHELIGRNAPLVPPAQELCLVLFATPGPIGYYLGAPGGAGDATPTFGMHTFPLPYARYRPLIEGGADLIVPQIRHIPAACIDPRIKQRSRLHWWLADREVQASQRGAQALLVDEHGHVTETAAANFLAMKNGVVISPPADRILGGVSLQVVRELTRELVIAFEERPLTVADCLSAEEAMLTSTPYCIAGVRSVNGQALPFPGPMFQRLRDAWSAAEGTNIHAGFE
jgi:branched-chain amino acid aminotransferase